MTIYQEEKLRSLCMQRMSNKDIATELNIPVNEVWAWRSRHHLTRKDVDRLLAEQDTDSISIKEADKPNRVIDLLKGMDTRELAEWLEAWRLESPGVCRYCEHYSYNCTDDEDGSCTDAVIKYLESEIDADD